MTASRMPAMLAAFCLATVALSQGPGGVPPGLAGPEEERNVYLVFFEEKPLATYRGTIPGLAATNSGGAVLVGNAGPGGGYWIPETFMPSGKRTSTRLPLAS